MIQRGQPFSQIFCGFWHFGRSIFWPIRSAHAIEPASFLEPSAMKTPVLTLNSIIQRDPEVIAAKADQDLIMVSVATGYYYGLSDVAREIWNAIGRPKRISDLVGDLTASYQIDSSSCEEQTLSFLEDLLDEGLLQVKDAPAG
jgi:hypothetical protein